MLKRWDHLNMPFASLQHAGSTRPGSPLQKPPASCTRPSSDTLALRILLHVDLLASFCSSRCNPKLKSSTKKDWENVWIHQQTCRIHRAYSNKDLSEKVVVQTANPLAFASDFISGHWTSGHLPDQRCAFDMPGHLPCAFAACQGRMDTLVNIVRQNQMNLNPIPHKFPIFPRKRKNPMLNLVPKGGLLHKPTNLTILPVPTRPWNLPVAPGGLRWNFLSHPPRWNCPTAGVNPVWVCLKVG